MCRMLGYVGAPVSLEDMLYGPELSLVKQTIDARMLAMLNLAGIGVMAWDRDSFQPEEPFTYRNTHVAVFDRNLRALASKIRANAVLAHVRGVPYNSAVQINEQNVHPFRFSDARLAMAHNGDLAGFREHRFDLLAHVKPDFARRIEGSTDSEWIYAILMSSLREPYGLVDPDDLLQALQRTLSVIREVRARHGITRSSSVNLMASDGETLMAVRFTFDFGRFGTTQLQGTSQFLSQWYTLGRDYGLHDGEWKLTGGAQGADSVLVASEPLTRDTSVWVEVPEYSALIVERRSEDPDRRRVRIMALDV